MNFSLSLQPPPSIDSILRPVIHDDIQAILSLHSEISSLHKLISTLSIDEDLVKTWERREISPVTELSTEEFRHTPQDFFNKSPLKTTFSDFSLVLTANKEDSGSSGCGATTLAASCYHSASELFCHSPLERTHYPSSARSYHYPPERDCPSVRSHDSAESPFASFLERSYPPTLEWPTLSSERSYLCSPVTPYFSSSASRQPTIYALPYQRIDAKEASLEPTLSGDEESPFNRLDEFWHLEAMKMPSPPMSQAVHVYKTSQTSPSTSPSTSSGVPLVFISDDVFDGSQVLSLALAPVASVGLGLPQDMASDTSLRSSYDVRPPQVLSTARLSVSSRSNPSITCVSPKIPLAPSRSANAAMVSLPFGGSPRSLDLKWKASPWAATSKKRSNKENKENIKPKTCQ
ncbi:hypothetical protein FPV67DRAFT_1508144 [Lyophyllum atratum]|nr:hypothetical protein FPV67DRAFT_1508144 [Lyophyllum atratum]